MSHSQDDLYQEAASTFGDALDRLVRAYEMDSEKRRDLLQEIHLALWRSFENFESRCSLRTWTYRVAHNTAASHVIRNRRLNSRTLLSLEEIDSMPSEGNDRRGAEVRLDVERLIRLIHRLRPMDREIMLLYLEDLDSAAIGEITGISAASVRTQIHRIKTLLARRFHAGRQQ